jgi:hypothetical protein
MEDEKVKLTGIMAFVVGSGLLIYSSSLLLLSSNGTIFILFIIVSWLIWMRSMGFVFVRDF